MDEETILITLIPAGDDTETGWIREEPHHRPHHDFHIANADAYEVSVDGEVVLTGELTGSGTVTWQSIRDAVGDRPGKVFVIAEKRGDCRSRSGVSYKPRDEGPNGRRGPL